MNRTIISGRLGKDIELKRTQTGKVVVNFDLAVYKSQDATDWIPIVAWEKTAERLAMSKKGDIIEIDGSITTRTYQNKEGVNIKVVEVLAYQATNFTKLFREKTQSNTYQEPKQTYQQPKPTYEEPDEPVLNINSDDLPF